MSSVRGEVTLALGLLPCLFWGGCANPPVRPIPIEKEAPEISGFLPDKILQYLPFLQGVFFHEQELRPASAKYPQIVTYSTYDNTNWQGVLNLNNFAELVAEKMPRIATGPVNQDVPFEFGISLEPARKVVYVITDEDPNKRSNAPVVIFGDGKDLVFALVRMPTYSSRPTDWQHIVQTQNRRIMQAACGARIKTTSINHSNNPKIAELGLYWLCESLAVAASGNQNNHHHSGIKLNGVKAPLIKFPEELLKAMPKPTLILPPSPNI